MAISFSGAGLQGLAETYTSLPQKPPFMKLTLSVHIYVDQCWIGGDNSWGLIPCAIFIN